MTDVGRTHEIVVVPGDGIGPEVTAAACRVVAAAGVKVRSPRILVVPEEP